MKNLTLLLVTILFVTTASAQQIQKCDISLSKPFSLGHNLMSDLYSGIVDVGFRYHLRPTSKLQYGIAANLTYFVNNTNYYFIAHNFSNSSNITYLNKDVISSSFVLTPTFFTKLPIGAKFSLNGGLGVSIQRYTSNAAENSMSHRLSQYTYWGPNANIGLNYDISSRLFLTTSYSYSYFARQKMMIWFRMANSNGTNDAIQNVKVGLGYKI